MSFYQELVNEINKVRRNPSAFADKLLGFKDCFKDTVCKLPSQKTAVQTQEGFAAYEEAAQKLKTLQPICDMGASKGLSRIAKDYLEKMKECSPDEVEKIEMEPIINKYGSFSGEFNNAMDFGSETPELVVINLVVSDGDPSRANRDLLLNPELKRIGIANGKHEDYGSLTIIVSCTEFTNVVDSNDNEEFAGAAATAPQTTATPPVTTTTTSTVTTTQVGGDDDPDVVSSDRRERIVIEHGKKKRKIIWMRKYKNGKKKKEVKYVLL